MCAAQLRSKHNSPIPHSHHPSSTRAALWQDVFSVDAMFEQLDFPYDVLWLDIEHTDGALPSDSGIHWSLGHAHRPWPPPHHYY